MIRSSEKSTMLLACITVVFMIPAAVAKGFRPGKEYTVIWAKKKLGEYPSEMKTIVDSKLISYTDVGVTVYNSDEPSTGCTLAFPLQEERQLLDIAIGTAAGDGPAELGNIAGATVFTEHIPFPLSVPHSGILSTPFCIDASTDASISVSGAISGDGTAFSGSPGLTTPWSVTLDLQPQHATLTLQREEVTIVGDFHEVASEIWEFVRPSKSTPEGASGVLKSFLRSMVSQPESSSQELLDGMLF